jgi:hypothetical protein
MSAVDSWIATIFEEAKKPIGSYGRFIGFAFGHFTGYNIFIALSSKKFCNDYLGMEDPPWKASQFVLWVAIYCMVTMVGVMIFVAERVEVQQKVTKFSHITKAFKQIFKKPMTKKWVFLTMFKSFGVDGVLQCITTVLVKDGVKKETIVLAYTLSSIPVLIGTIIFTKFLKKGKMMISVYYLLWFGLTLTFLDIYTYHDFKTNGDGNTLWLVFCSSLLAGWMKCALWIFDGGQVAIMCDESLNGTHFATMQFIYNVANALPYIIGVF